MDDARITVYRDYEIRTYRRRSQKYKDYRLSYIQRPDGSMIDLVPLGFAHYGETTAMTRIILRSNIADSHDGSLEFILPHVDADADGLVWAYFDPDILGGQVDWMPRDQCDFVDMGEGLRKYWKLKEEFKNGSK